MLSELTKQQHALYELMARTPNEDVNIPTMWRVVYEASERSPRVRNKVRRIS